MSIEALEPRIAPASVLNFTDIDGDHVTVTASSGDITAATHAAGLGVQIESIDATAAPGADLIVIVGKVHGGDGHVNIGEIDAQGVDLGKVVIPGDLGRILVGDGVFEGTALTALKVRSMGRFGTSTGASDLDTVIDGTLGILRVAGSIRNADIDDPAGDIGRIFIGGSLRGGHDDNSGSIQCDFYTIGAAWIGGDLIGGSGYNSGFVLARDGIGSIHVVGSIRGGAGEQSAFIEGDQNIDHISMAPIFIGGSIIGGRGRDSAGLYIATSAGLVVLGSVIGSADDSASIRIGGSIDIHGSLIGGSGLGSGYIESFSGGRIDIGGDVIGNSGDLSGVITFSGNSAVKIGGSLRGGNGSESGLVAGDLHVDTERPYPRDFQSLLRIRIGHDLIGGNGSASGAIETSFGSISSVVIGGSIIHGGDQQNIFTDEKLDHGTIFALDSIGSITVGGDIIGGDADFSSAIIARFGSIGSVEVGGSIVAGDAAFSGSISAGTTLSSLVVHGNVIGSADFPAVIRSLGTEGIGFPFADSVPTPAHIGSITIDGNITDGLITAGLRNNINSIPKDARIDSVTVGGDWTASNLIAGVSDGGDGRFGNGDDALIPGGKQSRIGSIAIGGNILGTGHSSGGSAFESHEIGAFSLGGSALELNDGGGNDSLSYALEGGGRLILREVR